MQYIIMCGGKYNQWEKPRHLLEINGEPIVKRTIRLLKENGTENVYISTNDARFEGLGTIVLHHENSYVANGYNDFTGHWSDAFYPTKEPACYIFGDVVFSPEAIKTIVETETKDIEFFASAPPFDDRYYKTSAEPFALKVQDQEIFRDAILRLRRLEQGGAFRRKPIMWELWQVIKNTPLNEINYHNYVAINDYTCDIDDPEDVEKIGGVV